MITRREQVPMIDAEGNRLNTTWTYNDDGQVCALLSIWADDHREIVRSDDTFVIKGSNIEVRVNPEPPVPPRSNVAPGWPK